MDEFTIDDEAVLDALRRDARASSSRYSTTGTSAFTGRSSTRPTGSNGNRKPNLRFLNNIIQDTATHNAALKLRELENAGDRLRALRGDPPRDKGAKAYGSERDRRERSSKYDSLDESFDAKERRHRGRHHSPSRQDRGRDRDRGQRDDIDDHELSKSSERRRHRHRYRRSRDRSADRSRSPRRQRETHRRRRSRSSSPMSECSTNSRRRKRTKRERKRDRSRDEQGTSRRYETSAVRHEEGRLRQESETREEREKRRQKRRRRDGAMRANQSRSRSRSIERDADRRDSRRRKRSSPSQDRFGSLERLHRKALRQDSSDSRRDDFRADDNLPVSHRKSPEPMPEASVPAEQHKRLSPTSLPRRQVRSRSSSSSSFGPSPPSNSATSGKRNAAPAEESGSVIRRGRGAHSDGTSEVGSGAGGGSAMDKHFAASYDPRTDVQPQLARSLTAAEVASARFRGYDMSSGSDSQAVTATAEARRRWQAVQRQRLFDAGFSSVDIKRWEASEASSSNNNDVRLLSESDVKWSKKGEGREWDRGKVLSRDGSIKAEADWARLVADDN